MGLVGVRVVDEEGVCISRGGKFPGCCRRTDLVMTRPQASCRWPRSDVALPNRKTRVVKAGREGLHECRRRVLSRAQTDAAGHVTLSVCASLACGRGRRSAARTTWTGAFATAAPPRCCGTAKNDTAI
jgi:hypothetical protein